LSKEVESLEGIRKSRNARWRSTLLRSSRSRQDVLYTLLEEEDY